ncbi:spastin-like [Dendronephthya gigantea]|uniref:spastin-like n=1 Tax=Dendronephthya gigantea TaxID=151771 RepID=UPI00106C5783|nr:spastin-like [Dendronephthya gigantea]
MTKENKNKLESNIIIFGKSIVRIVLFTLQLLSYGILQLFYVLIWSRLWGKMASKGGKGSSSKKQDEPNGDNGAIPPSIVDIRRHHKQSYAYIDKALRIDESAGNCDAKERAVECYKQGIEELKKGIEIQCDGQGEEWDRARNLQSKMEENLKSTTMRMDELVALLVSQSDDASKGSGVKSKSKISLPKSFKKPQPNGPSVSRTSNSNQAKTTTDKRKPSQSPRLNRRPVSRPESSRMTRVPSVNSMDELKKDQKRKVSYLKNIDTKIANRILDEVVQNSPDVTFEDVAGMENAKRLLQEIVILPALRPELFTGLRAPARGLLLYGPPGNGKTMLAKAVSHQSKATFFNVSAATLTSKWVGEGEKLVRALFAVARELQPSIIFIDEIDSLLCERKEGEQESSRRIKTEFLLAFDGLTSGENERILVMGATNRPQELDDAALRRLVKRVYLPLPDSKTRKTLLAKLLTRHHSPLSDSELEKLATLTENYSGSDLTALARDAALGPIREMNHDELQTISANKVRNIKLSDFVDSMKNVRASVSPETLKIFQDWTKTYGTQA